MTALLVTYDLNSPGQKYKALHDKIKSYPRWAYVMDSTWIVADQGLTPGGVATDLHSVMDSTDSLFVVDITGRAHQGWIDPDQWPWIAKNV